MSSPKQTVQRERVAIAYSTTPLYTCPIDGSVTYSEVTWAVCKNSLTTSSATLTLAIVTGNGTPGTDELTSNEYIELKTIAAKNTVPLEIVGATLYPGDYINEISGTAEALSVKLTIKEILP
jgi:hypothetical protein